jgi:ABC-type transporter Mla subunit MlaD
MKRTVAIAGVWMLLASAPLFAQGKKDPLTEQQIEDVREAGDQPLVRIKLYLGYVEERTKEIHSLSADASAQNKGVEMHNLFEEFTRLSDELQDNMDNFNDEHADLRKVLKEVVDKSGEWTTVLNEPKPSAQYDFMRKTAIDANQSVHDAATQMLADEVKYFADKKKADKEAEKNADKNADKNETR